MEARRTIGAGVVALLASFPARAAAQELQPFVPPPCVPGQEMFTDVPASNPFCAWIEQLSRDHITGGCGPQLFCPGAPLTRAQMSVFLELAMRGTDTWFVNADLLDGLDSTDFVTGVGAGTGLVGGGAGGSVTLDVAPTYQLPQTCTGGQHPEWTGGGWACGNPGAGTVTSVGTGAGLTGGPITASGTIGVAPGGITSAMIADGTVGGADVADGSIGTADVADGSIGTADVADGSIGAADVADGSIGAADVASAQVQLRVAAPCPPGEFIRAVNADGTVACAQDADSGGTVSSVATGAGLTGGPITGAGTVSVAPGGITSAMIADGTVAGADVADGSIGAADVAAAQVQLRVAAPCAPGQFMRAVNADGTVVCAADGNSGGTVTSVAAGAGLTGGPITGAGTLSVATGGITGAMIADGTIGAADVSSGQVQLRVAQSCSSTNFMRAVNADGTVTCAAQSAHDHFGQSWISGVAFPGRGLFIHNMLGDGIYGGTSSTSGIGVSGRAETPTGTTYGVLGVADSTSGTGVRGDANATTGTTYGVFGSSDSPSGTGVRGWAFSWSGLTVGVYGKSESVSGTGVRGEATFVVGGTDPSYGVVGINHRDLGAGVRGEGPTAGVEGTTSEPVNVAVGVRGTSSSVQGRGVLGEATATTGTALGVSAVSASSSGRAVQATATATAGTPYGVYATAASPTGIGVRAAATATSGVNYGLQASTASASGYAGFFSGRVHITSDLLVASDLSVGGTKNFKIDHPLDPANRYLTHAAVESSEVLNLYSGTVVLDAAGEAVVTLPDWFEALNRDFRYQLTCIGGYAPVYVSSEIADGRFGIAGGRAGLKVSWQVVGTRSDPHMLAHPMAVEEDKPEDERGTYLDPEAHGQPAERGRDYEVTRTLGGE